MPKIGENSLIQKTINLKHCIIIDVHVSHFPYSDQPSSVFEDLDPTVVMPPKPLPLLNLPVQS